jgi:hypothetical protein
MTSRDFAYWLQGFFEITDAAGQTNTPLRADQVSMIKKHLALVFYHEIDPSYSIDPVIQAEMNSIHSGKPPVYMSCGSAGSSGASSAGNAGSENDDLFTNVPPFHHNQILPSEDDVVYRC